MPELKKILIDKRTGRVVRKEEVKKRDRWRLLVAFLLTAIFSLLPDMHLEKMMGLAYSTSFDMLQHGGYYFVLTCCLFWLLPHEKRNFSFLAAIYFISVVFECMQLLIPGRTFSVLDITSNFIGIAGAFVLRFVFDALKEEQHLA